MSEKALVEVNAGVGGAFAESTIFEEEVPTTIDIPLKSFFDGADVIAEAMAFAMTTTTTNNKYNSSSNRRRSRKFIRGLRKKVERRK